MKTRRNHLPTHFLYTCTLILLLGLLIPSSVGAHRRGKADIATIRGVAVTGMNRLLGQPLWDSGTVFGPIGFNYLFAYDPLGSEPMELTPDTPPSTLLATGLDPFSLAVFGLTPEDFDPELVNLPLRETPVIVARDGTRDFIPSILEVPDFAPGRSLPDDAITLGEWLQAKGRAVIRCRGDGAAKLTLRLKGLIKHGIYTVWGALILDTNDDGFDEPVIVPLGGVPNALVADDRGRAVFRRVLDSCPLADSALKLIDVMYHSDGACYGAVPNQSFAGYPSGVVTHTHVEFPVNVEPLDY